MKYLYMASICFVLFGIWQICQIFENHNFQKFKSKTIYPSSLSWLITSLIFMIAIAARLQIPNIDFNDNIILLALSALAMSRYAFQTKSKMDLATSLRAVFLYSTFLIFSTLLFGLVFQKISEIYNS